MKHLEAIAACCEAVFLFQQEFVGEDEGAT